MSKKTIMRRLGLILLTGSVLAIPQLVSAQKASDDLENHWAKQTIESWQAKGLVKGYEKGSFNPNAPITRAELVKLINTSLGYTEVTSQAFKDVKAGDWFERDISIAIKSGYLSGYEDGTIKPNQPVLREEAAVMIQRMLWLPPNEESSFKDTSEMAPWSRGSVGALAKQNLVTGNNGEFNPKSTLTRAEAVILLDKLVRKDAIVIDQGGTYGPKEGQAHYPKNVVLNAPGIIFRNANVHGNLTIGSKVGQGDAFLSNVKVAGTTYVNGGGENSIHFENTVMLNVVVDKNDGTVRLVVEGKSLIGEMIIQSKTNIEAGGSSSVSNVTLSDLLPKDSKVRLTGSYGSVNVLAQSIVVDIPSGSINELNIDKNAMGNQINLDKETEIIKLILNAAASVLGDGGVKTAVVNASGVKMNKAPQTITIGNNVSSDTKIQIGDSPWPPNTSQSSQSGSSGTDKPPITIEPPTDRVPPVLKGVQRTVAIGTKLQLSSNEDGTIFIVPVNTTPTAQYLKLAVKDGSGKAYTVRANEPVSIDTANFDPKTMLIIATDNAENASRAVEVTFYDNSSLVFKSAGRVTTNRGIVLEFNQDIVNNTENIEALKKEISFSADGGITFSSLNPEDQVFIYSNLLHVSFPNRFTGSQNVIKINKHSLKDTKGNVYDQDILTNPVPAGTVIDIFTEIIKSGDSMIFQTDMAGTIYLIPEGTIWNDTLIETLVAQGKAKKMIVEETEINKKISIPTEGLAEGWYKLINKPQNGESGGSTLFMISEGFLRYKRISTNSNKFISISFDDYIEKTEDLETLKSKISISNDGGITFNPLKEEDTIQLFDSGIYITLKTKYTRTENVIKVEANALKSIHGFPNLETITKLDLVANLSLNSGLVLQKGQPIVFQTDLATDVYFAPADLINQNSLDDLIKKDLIKTFSVSGDDINQPVTIDTTDLEPGSYYLLINQGTSFYITIVD
ncbi:S-layer homology domain-containing protein [Paenibacillus guangzhouensis]|uniref:S-layer homology domain-containing protein n=1 Tax=Paenibacillus guangzhouensis TaxID=1473112 RepID=UPI0012668F97|nr:S-layer homology domain-containing protein [Paenibacillus guangzhouensis]